MGTGDSTERLTRQTSSYRQAHVTAADLRKPCIGDRLWTWADDHDQVRRRGVSRRIWALRTDVINVLPSNKEGKFHTSFLHKGAPIVHFWLP